MGAEGVRSNASIHLCMTTNRAGPGKHHKQNAWIGRKNAYPGITPVIMKRALKTLRHRTPYRIYFTSTLPNCQGQRRNILYNLPREAGADWQDCTVVIKYKSCWNREEKISGHGGIGRLGGFRFHCVSVQVRVLLPAPKHANPNLLPMGETFGFVVALTKPM